MNQRNWWIGIGVGGGLAAIGLGALIYMQHDALKRSREEVAAVQTQIADARTLVGGTGKLEREVIVLREVSEVIQEILPNDDDVNNLVRTLQRFSEESEVHISGLKKKNSSGKQSDFDRVEYTLSLEADAFQYLDFMSLIESHSRFMRIPAFKIAAASRSQVEDDGVPRHQMQIDVETYVYEPKTTKPVDIEGYERKRDLLMGEINRRREELAVQNFEYRGPRGRRDPWIDPRIPIAGDGESMLTVQEQMDIVQDFYERAIALQTKWEEVQGSENVIVEMMARAELEEMLVRIEEDLRRVTAEKSIRYVPSERRLQIEVVEPVAALREKLLENQKGIGPSEDALREVMESMARHQRRGEYPMMLEAFALVEKRLEYVEADPLRKPLVDRLRQMAWEARTIRDFDQFELDIAGLAIIEGNPSAVLINGRSRSVGDLVDQELVVHDIRPEAVEFIFRGVILARRF